MSRFGIIPASVFDHGLTPQEIALLALLSTYADRNGWCFPKYQTIADGLSRSKAWVSENMSNLESAGFLKVSKSKRGVLRYKLLYDTVQPSEQGVQPAERHLNSTNEHTINKRKKQKTDIPEGFCLTDDMSSWANKHNPKINPEEFTQTFILKVQAGGYQYVNWVSAWKTWFKNERNGNVTSRKNKAPNANETVSRFFKVARSINSNDGENRTG